MKILSLTAGAARMYCGSCLRDNMLAAELIALGHDVILLPLYTPTLTDDTNVSRDRVFFGGISIYLQQRFPMFRRLPRFLDGLWDSRWALGLASKSTIPTSPKLLGELTVATLEGQKRETAKLIDWLRTEPAPDVINLPYTLVINLARPIKEALGRPLTMTLQGEDLFLEGLGEPYRSRALALIRQNLEYVDAFLPVSEYYARFMSDYLGIPAEKMHVTPIGVRAEDFATEPRESKGEFTVGYFARIAPEKSLDLLCEACAILGPGVRLEAAGYLAPEHEPYLRDLQGRFKFHYHGTVDRAGKVAFLQSVDVLSVPSRYVEPKGLYVLEAMAAGVPVIQPRHGAFPEMIEKTGGGLLFEPNDARSLAETIRRLREDRALARELGRRGAAGVREHYSARGMAERALEVWCGVTSRGQG